MTNWLANFFFAKDFAELYKIDAFGL